MSNVEMDFNTRCRCEIGQPVPVMIIGGLQQYLIQNPKKDKDHHAIITKENESFNTLPDYIQLEIFSYLNARELCQISRVCQHWYWISSDNILWAKKLRKDMKSWDVINHTANPLLLLDKENWSNKEIYLRCSPDVFKDKAHLKSGFHGLEILYQVFWPRKVPRVVIFGPGLETSTGQIIRKIIEDPKKVFNVTGMFPGLFEGLGSGVTIKMSSYTFHLITLYVSSKKERELHHGMNRLQHNRLLRQQPPTQHNGLETTNDGTATEEPHYVVTSVVRRLCQTIDAFIYIVDSSENLAKLQCEQVELFAMISDECVKSDVPVAVLSCTPDKQTRHLSCIEVTEVLNLSKLNRPWQIQGCDVETMKGVPDAMKWLCEVATTVN